MERRDVADQHRPDHVDWVTAPRTDPDDPGWAHGATARDAGPRSCARLPHRHAIRQNYRHGRELSKKLREAMFTDNTSSGRKGTTTQKFWDLVNVCRDALAQLRAAHAEQGAVDDVAGIVAV
jgi:hypothetical protein